MIHVGIDYHKKFSHVVAMRDNEEIVFDGRIGSDRNAFEALRDLLPSGELIQSAIEAGPNWGVPFDALEELGMGPKLSNPLRTKLIGESFVKTDKIDATAIAMMLRVGILPLVHVPPKEVRAQKNLLRQRLWLVRLQTMLKNRIHQVVDRNHVQPPEMTDLFGKRGRAWLNALELPDPDGKLLRADLGLLDTFRGHVLETQKWIEEALKTNANMPILESLPGVGKLLSALIALEIDTIDRFLTPEKLAAYCGLAASTYSSGGKTTHGGLIPTCNHHLRYAFIEAAWTAARVSPYFSAYFRRLRMRKSPPIAIPAVARKLCEIAWHCLKRRRDYVEKPYRFNGARRVPVQLAGLGGADVKDAIKAGC